MGLRLTPSRDQGCGVRQRSAAQRAPSATAVLVQRAATAWRALDRRALLECLREADQLEPPHEPYRARKAMLEGGLALAGQLEPRRLERLYLLLCEAALTALEPEPREPELLNYAGVSFYELAARDVAGTLFEATLRLDPAHPDARRNLQAARSRRRVPPLAAATVATVKRLGGRARELAAAAQPVSGLRLSLCMIVRDEEEMLPRCLAAAREAVDEIVVVDTGSRDRTREIARDFGARVIDFAWTGSFADARNVSVDAATGDWILFLDADEVLVADDIPKLRALTGRTWREAFQLVETSYTGELEHGTAVTHSALRMFRNRPIYRFRGRLHEQFAWALPASLPERIEQTDVRVEHFGYLGVVRDARDKARRNIELLLRQAEESQANSFLDFNLGSEYLAIGDLAGAVRHLRRARANIDRDGGPRVLQFVPTLYVRLALTLRQLRAFDEAIEVLEEGARLFPDLTDLVFERAWVEAERGRLEEAERLFERCLEMGEAPSRYTSMRGCGSHLARIGLAEIATKRGDTEAAERHALLALEEGLAHPAAVLFAASVLVRRGASAEEVTERVERRLAATPTNAFLVGIALYEGGHVAAAEERFRKVCALQPGNDRARVAHGEALLSMKRWADAAATCAGVPDDSPVAEAARRCELFARLAAGDADTATAALERARAVLDAAELAVFEGWRDRLKGRDPGLLPAASAALLCQCLDALLRVEEIDTFAQLVPLLERCTIAARERRELLAGIYLRRGFLDSAAEEWIAACHEHGPDPDALIGLAQVAYAKGMLDDALVFAEEARQRAPTDARCIQLHQHLARLAGAGSDEMAAHPERP